MLVDGHSLEYNCGHCGHTYCRIPAGPPILRLTPGFAFLQRRAPRRRRGPGWESWATPERRWKRRIRPCPGRKAAPWAHSGTKPCSLTSSAAIRDRGTSAKSPRLPVLHARDMRVHRRAGFASRLRGAPPLTGKACGRRAVQMRMRLAVVCRRLSPTGPRPCHREATRPWPDRMETAGEAQLRQVRRDHRSVTNWVAAPRISSSMSPRGSRLKLAASMARGGAHPRPRTGMIHHSEATRRPIAPATIDCARC